MSSKYIKLSIRDPCRNIELRNVKIYILNIYNSQKYPSIFKMLKRNQIDSIQWLLMHL